MNDITCDGDLSAAYAAAEDKGRRLGEERTRMSLPIVDRPELADLILRARKLYDDMSPEEKTALHEAQSRSWTKQDKD